MKIVYEAHNVYYYISDKVRTPETEVECLQIPDLIIATTEGIKRDLIALGVEGKKISVAANGVGVEKHGMPFDRHILRERARISEEEVVIIYSGSWMEWKGVDLLIKAYAIIAEKAAHCKLILIGAHEDEILKTEKLIQNLAIDRGRILVVPFSSQREVDEYLKIADIGIIPTRDTIVGRRYTSPLKLFDYMAAELAIVASDLPSLREILSEENAVLFEPGNDKDLAEKVVELIVNKPKRNLLKFANRQRIKDFSYEERCRKVMEVIARTG